MIPTFLFTLAAGIWLILATARYPDIAWKFLRLCGFLTLAILTLAAAAVYLYPDRPDGASGTSAALLGGLAALGCAVLALLAPLAARASRLFRLLAVFTACPALCAATLTMMDAPGSRALSLLAIGNTTAALLLGAITVAWLLGHAYLTATRMTIAPLRHVTRMLSGAVMLRVLFVAVSVALSFRTPASSSVWSQLTNQWIIVFLRAGLGLFAVGLFAWMVGDCVRRRATQSATGILYFGSLFAYVGELAAQHLTRELAWPL